MDGTKHVLSSDILSKALHSEIISAALHVHTITHQKSPKDWIMDLISSHTHLHRAQYDAKEVQIMHSLRRFNTYEMSYICGIKHLICQYMSEEKYTKYHEEALNNEQEILFKQFDSAMNSDQDNKYASSRDTYYKDVTQKAEQIERYSDMVCQAKRVVA